MPTIINDDPTPYEGVRLMVEPIKYVHPIQMHRIQEASEISRLSRSTLYAMIKDGRLKSIKVGGSRLIPDSSLRELLQVD